MASDPEFDDAPRPESDPGPDEPRASVPPPDDLPKSPLAPRPSPTAERLPPVPPPPPPVGQGPKLISNALLMLLGAILAAGGFGLARAFVPPRPPTEILPSNPSPELAKATDLKAIAERDDALDAKISGIAGRLDTLPSPAAELKMMVAQLDALSQKFDVLARRVDGLDEKPAVADLRGKLDDATRRIDEIAGQVAAIRPNPPAAGPAPAPADINVEGQAMAKAASLFEDKKYAEARDAFAKLRVDFPDDARVWYYSALATGFATRQWEGEAQKLVMVGLEKEKAGSPPAAQVDAVFANLTTATGKDWLAGWRKRIAR